MRRTFHRICVERKKWPGSQAHSHLVSTPFNYRYTIGRTTRENIITVARLSCYGLCLVILFLFLRQRSLEASRAKEAIVQFEILCLEHSN